MIGNDTTDMMLFVRTSQHDIVTWDRRRIVDALIRETNIDITIAESISKEVEKEIITSGMELLTAPLIRELVNAKLIERGLGSVTTLHARLGFPVYDVEQIILNQNKENANIPHSPEGTNLTLAEGVKKEFAVRKVFSGDVAYAHMIGDIHIHNLGYIDRPYCSCQSLEYIKKFGLNLPNALAVAAPARHAEVLLSHMVRFAAALQGNFAGAIGWDALNVFFAPYLVEMSDHDILQLAQRFVYEYAQQAVGRGGQTIFTDIHLYWEVPRHLAEVPAIGPGGEYTGQVYRAYAGEAQRFVRALLDVYRRGDNRGLPFVFPRPIIHLADTFFESPENREFLLTAAAVAADKGNPHFIFERGETARLSECCYMNFAEHPQFVEEYKQPWKLRSVGVQNVSINLPRIAYKAEGDDKALFSLLGESVKRAVQAHIEKKQFIERLMSYGEDGPLSLMVVNNDGKPFYAIDHEVFLVGMVGLNELVAAHHGTELHQSVSAWQYGLDVVASMRTMVEEESRKHQIRCVLQQTPAESTPYRFARLDLKHYSPMAGRFVKGNLARGEVYYTNSTHFNSSAPVEPMERVRLEGAFHQFIEGEIMTLMWLGESHPAPEFLADFVEKVFRETKNQHVVFSPDFSFCRSCGRVTRGLPAQCSRCGESVEGVARITGYYSTVSRWNRGKLAELANRRRWNDPSAVQTQ